jgi:hypothetical protein
MPGTASNCIHALSDIDTDTRLLETGTARGEAASYLVLEHLQRSVIGSAGIWGSTSL